MSSCTNPSLKQRFHRWIANKRIHLEEISDFISQQLSKEQLEKLSINTEQGIYSFKDQILLSYVDNRYELYFRPSQKNIIVEIEKCIKEYGFLWESNLDPKKLDTYS